MTKKNTERSRFAEAVGLWLAARNMSQGELSAAVGISESSLCRFLRGERALSQRAFLALLTYLNS